MEFQLATFGIFILQQTTVNVAYEIAETIKNSAYK
jgi:hypothetical protein